MSRRKSRTAILKILYKEEFYSEKLSKNQNKKDFFVKNLNPSDTKFVFDYLKGIKKNKDCLDQTITKYTRNWKIHRISLVDLNIMRLAIFEILFCPEIPDKVALNEALELAKQFSEKDSVSFINGVLDQIIKS